MAKAPFHRNGSGMDKALDLVEEAILKLKEREEHAIQNQRIRAEACALVDAQTSTSNLCPALEASGSSQRDTSVLINRKPNRLSNCSRGRQHHTSVTVKTKAKKNPSSLLARSQSRQRSRAFEQDNVEGNSVHRSSRESGHKAAKNSATSASCLHRKQQYASHEGNGNESSRRRVRDDSHYSRNSASQILRNVNSQDEEMLINTRGGSSWVPPLSQSSPRELRSRNKSGCFSPAVASVPEVAIPSYLNFKGLSKDRSSELTSSFKPTVPLSCQKYAQPTLTSQLRVKLSEHTKKVEKENIIPFIPSGSTNKSHHVAVIMQQKLGLLKNMPPKELDCLTEAFNRPETKSNEENESFILSEDVKTAISNVQQHIALVVRHTSKS